MLTARFLRNRKKIYSDFSVKKCREEEMKSERKSERDGKKERKKTCHRLVEL